MIKKLDTSSYVTIDESLKLENKYQAKFNRNSHKRYGSLENFTSTIQDELATNSFPESKQTVSRVSPSKPISRTNSEHNLTKPKSMPQY